MSPWLRLIFSFSQVDPCLFEVNISHHLAQIRCSQNLAKYPVVKLFNSGQTWICLDQFYELVAQSVHQRESKSVTGRPKSSSSSLERSKSHGEEIWMPGLEEWGSHKQSSRVAVKCLISAATTTAADWSKPSQPCTSTLPPPAKASSTKLVVSLRVEAEKESLLTRM